MFVGLALFLVILITGGFIGKIGAQAVIAQDCEHRGAVTFDAWIYKQPVTLRCDLAGLITLAEHY
jgi:hypothetical protein